MSWRGIVATGLFLMVATFLFPWSTYTKAYYPGPGQQTYQVVRPLAFFLQAGRKVILWDQVMLQSGVIVFATSALGLIAANRGRK